ncbi:MAG: DUF4198 domain-containing protein [Acidobacteriota bacterium]
MTCGSSLRRFRPQAGEIVAIRLRVGQEMLGDPIPYSAQLAKQFNSTAGKLVAREGNDPAGLLRIEEAGLAIVTYFSNASSVEQVPEKFAAYVKEEGLEGIAARRDGKTVREWFTRCAKSLVGTGAGQDRAVGMPLELVAEGKGGFRLLWQAKPLAGALVVARNKQGPMEKITARTGADGRVRLNCRVAGCG